MSHSGRTPESSSRPQLSGAQSSSMAPRALKLKLSKPIDVDGRAVVPHTPKLVAVLAYAAPLVGTGFFYMPMWSVLPGIYAKYFGLSLASIATCVLLIRLFDGVVDATIGYLSDVHRSLGGSRRTWVMVGNCGSVVACYFLFAPPQPATLGYYLSWSLAYFFAFTMAVIPHSAWGNELTMDYEARTRVFGVCNIMQKLGNATFYVLPMVPIYKSSEFTPQIIRDTVYVGGGVTLAALLWMSIAAPRATAISASPTDSLRLLIISVIGNRPLLLYIAAFGCVGLSFGMWFGLLFFYLDGYLAQGAEIAVVFLVGLITGSVTIPLWVKVVNRIGKSVAWGAAVSLFVFQLLACWFVSYDSSSWIPLTLISVGIVFLTWHDTAAMSSLGDIIDYGKLKFHVDRGGTYTALNTLTFKVGLGVGGGTAIGIASRFGFSLSLRPNSDYAVSGLKLGFIVLPACLALVSLIFILGSPIDRRRHAIIQRRIEARLCRGN